MKRIHTTLLATILMSAGIASAATVTECIGDVTIAQSTVNAATTFANARDQLGLSDKATSAVQKLDKGKFYDASLDLAAMSQKVFDLVNAPKPKLGADDGAAISGAVGTAQTCVAQLMAQ